MAENKKETENAVTAPNLAFDEPDDELEEFEEIGIDQFLSLE